ncbi:zinc finger domain-containing protein [Streptomyces sp. NPDC002073]
MTPEQIAALLHFAAKQDSRVRRSLADPQQTARTIAEWSDVLADVPATLPESGWDAARATRRYYEQQGGNKSSQFRAIEPHDLLAAWGPYRAELMNRHTDPVPAADPDDPEAWRKELLGTRAAVARGNASPAQYRAEINHAGQRRLAALISGVGAGPRRYMPAHVATELAQFRPSRAHREQLVAEGLPDPLCVRCPYCLAPVDQPCQSSFRTRGKGRRPLTGVHPSRVEALLAHQGDEEQADAEQVRIARIMCQPPAPRRDARARHTSGGAAR